MHRPADAKVYVLVRGDLAPGLQMAQAVHAAAALAVKYPTDVRTTPNVVVLAVPDEEALLDAWAEGRDRGYHGVLFNEPDVNDEATAYAEVSDGSRFSSLPLAGRTPAMT